MKIWKVILAAVVIFSAGIVTGALTNHLQPTQNSSKTKQRHPGHSHYPEYLEQRRVKFLHGMEQQLVLSQEQRSRIEKILLQSHERMLAYPKQEFRRVCDEIKAELTPEQRSQFEELFPHKNRKREKQNADD